MPDSTKELKQRARKLRELARQAEKAAGGKEDVHREKMAEKSRARSRERREVDPLPPVRDPGRRARCERDLELFARTYFPNRFPWPEQIVEAATSAQDYSAKTLSTKGEKRRTPVSTR